MCVIEKKFKIPVICRCSGLSTKTSWDLRASFMSLKCLDIKYVDFYQKIKYQLVPQSHAQLLNKCRGTTDREGIKIVWVVGFFEVHFGIYL